MSLIDTLFGREKSVVKPFHGGLTLPAHKAISTAAPAQHFPLVERYHLSLWQRDGNWLTPLVSVGDVVLAGQMLAQPSSAAGVALHAPTSGVIAAIAARQAIATSDKPVLSIVLAADGEDRFSSSLPPLDETAAPEVLLQRIIACGIAGMGGAGFPSANKLRHPATTLLVNAAECEPYITCDDMQIREHSAEIVRGAQLCAHIVGGQRVLFAIEDDKAQAIIALERAVAAAGDPHIEVKIVPTRYPSGNTRQLFELLLGIRVPADRHATDFGLICHNSATIKAIHDALVCGRPLIERYVSITGEGVVRPQVAIVRLGTPLQALIEAAGGRHPDSELLIGGAMMGITQKETSAGIEKTTNCLLLLPRREHAGESDCIRCARCSDACPMMLLPQQLYWYSRNLQGKRLEQYRLFDCIECGICASVCPAHIPLVRYYRDSKAVLRKAARQQTAATHAKRRHDARNKRLQRQAEERKTILAAKRAGIQATSIDPKKEPEREKTPTATTGTQMPARQFDPSRNGKTNDHAKQAAIEAAKARAAARKQARLSSRRSGGEKATYQPPLAPNGDEKTKADTAETATEATRRADYSPISADKGQAIDGKANASLRQNGREKHRQAQCSDHCPPSGDAASATGKSDER